MKLSVPVTVTDSAGASATATASTSVVVHFGVNLSEYAAVSPAVTGISWTKSFADTGTNGVPDSWPGNKAYPVPAGTTTLACFDPVPEMVLAGTLDGPLTEWFGMAPEGSWVTAWGEGNRSTNAYGSQPGASAAQFTAMHGYLRDLAAKASPGLLVGACFSTYPVHAQGQDIAAWTCPGLAFYVLDGYQTLATDTPASVFGGALAGIRSAEPSARLAIAETNSLVETTGAWFEAVLAYLTGENGILFSSFWGSGGSQAQHEYPFSATAGYVSVLRGISDTCAA